MGRSRDTEPNPAVRTRTGDWLGCMEKKFVRYEASMPNGRGLHPGIFALANGLASDGRLSTKRTATHLLTGVEFYTDLLHRYGVGWRVRYSNDPGRILYEDDVQIVVAPH